jgi:hypothetical protein
MILLPLLLSLQAPAAQVLQTHRVQPLRYGSYDFTAGFTETPQANRSLGPEVLFDSISCAAYYFGTLPGPKQEFVDEGALLDRGLSGVEEINGVSWEYCDLGFVGAFDAILSLYTDTVTGVGPSAWVPGVPSFADCLYLITGLPDGGCWNVMVDLSGGGECMLPQNSNPASGAMGTFGWSVTSLSTLSLSGPLLTVQACATAPSRRDLVEWRDWTGAFAGTPYSYVRTLNGTGAPKVSQNFSVALFGTPEDVRSCSGSGSNDTLRLQARDNAEPGALLDLVVEAADPVARSYVLLVATGACQDLLVLNGYGTWTRHVAVGSLVVTTLFTATGPVFGSSLAIPAGAPPDSLATMQIVEVNGLSGSDSVSQASNGIEFYL